MLLEQKRLLEQLRHERQVAAGDQHLGSFFPLFAPVGPQNLPHTMAIPRYWLHRKNRLDHEDHVVGKAVDAACPPEELLEAHQRMRADPEAEGQG